MSGSPRRPPSVLHVASLNLWGRWADWRARCAVLVEHWPDPAPDVVMLQEVVCDSEGDQAEELGRALGYGHVEQAEGHRHGDGREGLAVLSRLPLHQPRAADLPASEPGRRVLMTMVETSDGPVHLACAHTVAVPDDIRMRQILEILRLREEPLVIGADLNETPAIITPLLRDPGLVDCLAAVEDPTWPMCAATFGAAWEALQGRAPHFSLTPRRLDYLLTRSMRPLAAGVHPLEDGRGRFASDHALVWATLLPAVRAANLPSRKGLERQ